MLMRGDMDAAEEIDWLGPAPKRRGVGPEMLAQQAVREYLAKVLPPGSVVQAFANETSGARAATAKGRARYGAMRRKSGINAGMPDLILFLPGGRTFLIEMKSATGRLSPAQREMHEKLIAIGHSVAVARCIDTARMALRAAGIPTREAA